EDNAMTHLSRLILTAGIAIAVVAGASFTADAQQRFKTPDDAVTALVAAVRADNVRDMIVVLGAQGRDIVISGDDVADQTQRAAFLIAYDLKHQIVKKDDNRADLVIGNNDWQLPIPLVQKGGAW